VGLAPVRIAASVGSSERGSREGRGCGRERESRERVGDGSGGPGSHAVTTAAATLAVAPDPTIQHRFNVHDQPDMTSLTGSC
jgi:hypothetical protein